MGEIVDQVLSEEGFSFPAKRERFKAPQLTEDEARAWLSNHVCDRFGFTNTQAETLLTEFSDRQKQERRDRSLENFDFTWVWLRNEIITFLKELALENNRLQLILAKQIIVGEG